MKALPIGRDNFRNIMDEDCYYVDKTKAIEELMQKRAYVTLFPRPRRFGKSLLISTINEFFNIEKKEKNKDLFEGLYINTSEYKKEQGKYPVIKLNFKSFQSDNWENMYLGIKEIIRQVFEDKRYVMQVLTRDEKELYGKFLSSSANEAEYKQSIQLLSKYLERYWSEKVILLIDEYDVPIQNGYLSGFYKDIVGFIKSLFNNSLKTNDSIKFAVMTGVLRVSKESIFSDLNNVEIYSIVDESYDEYFGFTESETKKLLQYYQMELTNEVKEMYDGYIFGKQEIYNPWSIINYANRKKIYPYWVNTSGDELLKDIFIKTQSETAKMIEQLLLKQSISTKYNEKVTFLDLSTIQKGNAQETVANFLLMSGYLTIVKKSDIGLDKKIELKVPNEEIRQVFNDVISSWMNEKEIGSNKLFEIQDALLENNSINLELLLNEALQSMSFYDEQENFYHGYMLGLFVQFLNSNYIVKSNREAGEGRFDIMIESIDRKTGIIVEFKVAKEDETLEERAEIGKKQIYEKKYYEELKLDKVENIYTYSVAFKGKKCKVM